MVSIVSHLSRMKDVEGDSATLALHSQSLQKGHESLPSQNGTGIPVPPSSDDLLPFPHQCRAAQPTPMVPTDGPRTASPGGHACGPAPAPPSSGCRHLGLHLRRSGRGGRRVPRRTARYAAVLPGECSIVRGFRHLLCDIHSGPRSGFCNVSGASHCREMWLGHWQNSTKPLSWIHGRSSVRAPNICFCLSCASERHYASVLASIALQWSITAANSSCYRSLAKGPVIVLPRQVCKIHPCSAFILD
jgi:hypothetical protein